MADAGEDNALDIERHRVSVVGGLDYGKEGHRKRAHDGDVDGRRRLVKVRVLQHKGQVVQLHLLQADRDRDPQGPGRLIPRSCRREIGARDVEEAGRRERVSQPQHDQHRPDRKRCRRLQQGSDRVLRPL